MNGTRAKQESGSLFAVVHVPTGSPCAKYDTYDEAAEALSWYAENWPSMARRLEVREVSA